MHVGRYLNGYDFRDGIPAGYTDGTGARTPNAFNYTNWKVNENGVLRSYPRPERPDDYQTDRVDPARGGPDRGRRALGQPFYMSLWYVAPHRGGPRDLDDPPAREPLPAPRHRDAFAGYSMPRLPNFNEKKMFDKPQVVADRPRFSPEKVAGIEENWRQEIESLMAVDEGVAQIMEALRRNGELENTLIVYMSDNGFMHGEHRALAEKVLPYEPSIRIPLLMRGPGIPRGRVDQRLVANLDVPATILDAAGVSPGASTMGARCSTCPPTPARSGAATS